MCVCVCVLFEVIYYLKFNNLLQDYLFSVLVVFTFATHDLWIDDSIYNVHMFSMEHADDDGY